MDDTESNKLYFYRTTPNISAEDYRMSRSSKTSPKSPIGQSHVHINERIVYHRKKTTSHKSYREDSFLNAFTLDPSPSSEISAHEDEVPSLCSSDTMSSVSCQLSSFSDTRSCSSNSSIRNFASISPHEPLYPRPSPNLPIRQSPVHPNERTMYHRKKTTSHKSYREDSFLNSFTLDPSPSSYSGRQESSLVEPPLSQYRNAMCTYCLKASKSIFNWENHEVKRHRSMRPKLCIVCGGALEFVSSNKNKTPDIVREIYQHTVGKKPLRQRFWGCGYCCEKGIVPFKSWQERCTHVARHIRQRVIPETWSFTTLILGLLEQPNISAVWTSHVQDLHNSGLNSYPRFYWNHSSALCQELLRELEIGIGLKEERIRVVKMAYILGAGSALADRNRASCLSMYGVHFMTEARKAEKSSSPSNSDVTSEDDTEDDYDSETEAAPDPLAKSIKAREKKWLLPAIADKREKLFDLTLHKYRYILPGNPYFPRRQHCTLHGTLGSHFCDSVSDRGACRNIKGNQGDGNVGSCAANDNPSNQRSNAAICSATGTIADVTAPLKLNKNKKLQSEEEGDDDEKPNKRRKVEIETFENSKAAKKLACPYYLRDPENYCNQRSCPGPGWNDVHRLKEHLYKRHRRPIQCARCWICFESHEEHRKHQRQAQSCHIKPEALADGLDGDQETELRSKKRIPGISTEVDKWRRVWKILFPLDDEANIPEPYYTMPKYRHEDANDTSEAFCADFGEYLDQKLYLTLREQLLQNVPEERKLLEESVKDQIVATAFTCITKLLSDYSHWKKNNESSLFANAESSETERRLIGGTLQPSSDGVGEERNNARDISTTSLSPTYTTPRLVSQTGGEAVEPDLVGFNNSPNPGAAVSGVSFDSLFRNWADETVLMGDSSLPGPGSPILGVAQNQNWITDYTELGMYDFPEQQAGAST